MLIDQHQEDVLGLVNALGTCHAKRLNDIPPEMDKVLLPSVGVLKRFEIDLEESQAKLKEASSKFWEADRKWDRLNVRMQ